MIFSFIENQQMQGHKFSCQIGSWQKWFYLGKLVLLGQKVDILEQKWLYLGKLVLFGQIGSVWAKGGCIWAKVIVFEQIGSIWANWLYLGKG